MRFGSSKFVSLCAVFILGLMVGCGGGGEEPVVDNSAERSAALEALGTTRQALADQRAGLEQLRGQIADPSTIEVPEGEELPTVEDLEAKANALKAEIESATDAFGSQIVAFINEDPPIEGEPLNEVQKAAIGMKIDEDILVAREWIETGGDYRRAINILESLIPLDPENENLRAELASAEEMRYMTEERFKTIKKGFSEEQVREALGSVNLRNIKDYPEKKATAWFYPKEDGGAAAVFFQKKGNKSVVYQLDFNAVKQKVIDSEG